MNGVVLEVAHLCLGLLPSPGGLLPSWLDARLVGLGGILFSKTLCSSASAPVVCISPGLSQGIDALRHRLSDPESVHDVPRARRHHGGRNANGPRRGIDQRRTSRSGHRGRRPLVSLSGLSLPVMRPRALEASRGVDLLFHRWPHRRLWPATRGRWSLAHRHLRHHDVLWRKLHHLNVIELRRPAARV